MICCGCEYVPPDFIARHTSATILLLQDGAIYQYGNTGLTVGNSYTILTRMYCTAAGNFYITGNGYKSGGGTWADSSDEKLKKNIAPMDSGKALDTLLSLYGKNYQWADESKGTDIETGFIAGDVEKCFPKWVSITDEGYKAVGFRNEFLAYVVEALREIVTRLEKVEGK